VSEAPNELNRNLQVLIVDDVQTNRTVTAGYLARFGIEAQFAETGLEAVELVKTSCFHLILVDINMPEMDGLEATKLIRAYEQSINHRSLIAAYTASVSETIQDRLTLFGFDGILGKPPKTAVLHNLLRGARLLAGDHD
jgi:CheY-like chemotaxis protein